MLAGPSKLTHNMVMEVFRSVYAVDRTLLICTYQDQITHELIYELRRMGGLLSRLGFEMILTQYLSKQDMYKLLNKIWLDMYKRGQIKEKVETIDV